MAMTLSHYRELTRRDPFVEFDAMIRRAFPARTAAGTAATRTGFVPAAEIVREGDDALIALDAPGLDFANDITVELDGTTLVVSGERRDRRTERTGRTDESDGRVLSEVRYGSFKRSFTLPENVTADAVSAAYDAGVLTVRITGAYTGTQPQKITVTAGRPSDAVTVDGSSDEDGAGVTADDVAVG